MLAFGAQFRIVWRTCAKRTTEAGSLRGPTRKCCSRQYARAAPTLSCRCLPVARQWKGGVIVSGELIVCRDEDGGGGAVHVARLRSVDCMAFRAENPIVGCPRLSVPRVGIAGNNREPVLYAENASVTEGTYEPSLAMSAKGCCDGFAHLRTSEGRSDSESP